MRSFISSSRLVCASDIFESPPQSKKERLDIIRHIPKDLLVYALSMFNMRMMQGNQNVINYLRWEYQISELCYFCRYDNGVKSFMSMFIKEYDIHSSPIFFTRLSTLIAIREILELDEPDNDLYDLVEGDWVKILCFLLSINEAIKEHNHSFDHQEAGLAYTISERLAVRHQLLNELAIRTHPIAPMNRLFRYVDYLMKLNEYKRFIASQFAPVGFDIDAFLRHVIRLHKRDKKDNGLGETCLIPIKDLESSKILGMLSNSTSIKPPKHFLDIECLRFSPLYKHSDTKFIMIDRDLVIDKVFDQLVNDFFTIYLEQNSYVTVKKNKELKEKNFSIKDHRSVFGVYFESYIENLLNTIEEEYSDSCLLALDRLKRDTEKGSVELSDVYFRIDKNIILGEIKAKGIGAEQRNGSVESFLDASLTKDSCFYNKFGLHQIIRAIAYLKEDYSLFEGHLSSLNKGTKLDIYPTLIVNDKLFYSPFINFIFNEEFDRRIDRSQYPNFVIHKLVIVEVESLEIIAENVKYKKKADLFKLLYQYSSAKQSISFYNYLIKEEKLDFPCEFYLSANRELAKRLTLS